MLALKFKILIGIFFAISTLTARVVLAASGITDDYYNIAMDRERSHSGKDGAAEMIASGAAATIIGFYGYYFDDRGSIAKLIYAGTQTAGVLGIGAGVRRYFSDSLHLRLEEISEHTSLDRETLKRQIAANEYQNMRANWISGAVTGGLLTVIYGYAALREQSKDDSVRNIYIFLGVNALAIGSYSALKVYDSRQSLAVTLQGPSKPVLTWLYRF